MLTTEHLDTLQDALEFRNRNKCLKESITIIANFIDNHLREDANQVFEVGDKRYKDKEQLRAINAERSLKDGLPHHKLRQYLYSTINCIDMIKPMVLRKSTVIALEQVHLVFETLLSLKPHLKKLFNN